MEKEISRRTERKVGKTWVEQSSTTDPVTIYKTLANCLSSKYNDRARWVSRISKRRNYDSTYTYTISYGNGFRDVIRADI